MVLIHGALVAVMQGGQMWPMFAFGFGGILVITQMYGLKLSNWLRWSILGAYIGLALLVYSERGLGNIHQITWIPIIEYLAVLLLAGIFWLGLLVSKKLRER